MNEFFKKPVVKILMLKGEKGDKGNTGEGFPKGGKTGQYLQKKSNADYDFAWSPITTVSWDNVSGKTNATESASGLMSAADKSALDGLKTHSHGLLNNNFSADIPKNSENMTWNELLGEGGKRGHILKSVRSEDSYPEWIGVTYGSGIVFGGLDTKGLIMLGPFNPKVRVVSVLNGKVKWRADLLNSENYTEYVKSTTKSFTLSAASWSSGSYTISDSLITETSNQEILPAIGATADQMKALQKANIIDSGQSAGSLTLKALGTVPSIDIPIRIIFRGTI